MKRSTPSFIHFTDHFFTLGTGMTIPDWNIYSNGGLSLIKSSILRRYTYDFFDGHRRKNEWYLINMRWLLKELTLKVENSRWLLKYPWHSVIRMRKDEIWSSKRRHKLTYRTKGKISLFKIVYILMKSYHWVNLPNSTHS